MCDLTRQNPTPRDADLVGEALSGRREAYDALVERHFGLVYVIALGRLGDDDSSRDLTQEVFLRAYLQLAKLRERDRFAAWVARMARNLGIQWVRRRQTASRLVPLVYLEAQGMATTNDSAASPRSDLERQQDARAVRDAILRLPPAEREAVLLHYVQGLPQNEIAARLGLHPSTIARTLERARTRMKPGLSVDLGLVGEALRPPDDARARTLSCIALAAALTPAVRESLAATAAKTVPAVVSQFTSESALVAGVGWLAGMLQNTQAFLASGGLAMGYGKSTLIAGAALVAVVGGGVAVQQTMSTPARSSIATAPVGQIQSAPAAAATADAPLKLDLARERGRAWRATTSMTGTADGEEREMERMVIRGEVLDVGPGGVDTLLTIEKVDVLVEYRPGVAQGAPGMAGRQFIIHSMPDGTITSARVADGKVLEPNDMPFFVHAMQGLAIPAPPPTETITPGQTWISGADMSLPDQPNSSVKGKDTLEFVGYEMREGRRVAILRIDSEVVVSNVLAQRREQPPAVMEARLDRLQTTAVTEFIVDPQSGRVMKTDSLSHPAPLELTVTVTIPRRPPSVQKVQETDQGGRQITIFEYLN